MKLILCWTMSESNLIIWIKRAHWRIFKAWSTKDSHKTSYALHCENSVQFIEHCVRIEVPGRCRPFRLHIFQPKLLWRHRLCSQLTTFGECVGAVTLCLHFRSPLIIWIIPNPYFINEKLFNFYKTCGNLSPSMKSTVKKRVKIIIFW
jgi:hypothetical protein